MRRSLVPEIKRELILKLASQGKREDGRELCQFREMDFETGIIGTANGSARMNLGDTQIIVGVKLQLGAPYPDKPDQGVLMTGCELKPMAHPEFQGGAPSDEAIEIARVVDRGIRESGMIDMHALCKEEGKEVWMVFLDIQVLNYDGNLFDAATMACVLALHDAQFPDGGGLPVEGWPLTCTFIKIDSNMLADPTDTEEAIAEARFTVSMDGEGHIRAMQKGLKGALTYDDVARALDDASDLISGLRASLQKDHRV